MRRHRQPHCIHIAKDARDEFLAGERRKRVDPAKHAGQLVRTADVLITLPIERVETDRDVHAQRCQPPNERFGKPGAICNQHGEEAEGAEIFKNVGNIVA